MDKLNWLDNLVEFYDFIWREGTMLCEHHVNQELMEDFADGGDKFEQMKKAIIAKFPTIEDAKREYLKKATP